MPSLRNPFSLPDFPDPPFVRTRYPVVLIHGFGSLGTVGRPGLLYQQAQYLRHHGVLAYAPNVTPYDTVAVRCRHWTERIDRILSESGAEKINLIGYSAGGLDARYLASTAGYGDRIASVITVNTPHQGSDLAEWGLSKTGPIRRVPIMVMDLAGRLVYKNAEPRVAAGMMELRPRHLKEHFNPSNPDVDGVFYGSWAGAAGKGTDTRITPLLLIQNRILYGIAGVNDGMVPTESARWGETLGTAPSDHLRMAGVAPGSRGFSNSFFLDIARDLAARGF